MISFERRFERTTSTDYHLIISSYITYLIIKGVYVNRIINFYCLYKKVPFIISDFLSFGQKLKVLLLRNLPIILRTHRHITLNYIASLISTLFVFYCLQLYLPIFMSFVFLKSSVSIFWSHFNKLSHILPKEAFIVRLIKRVKVIRLCIYGSAFVYNLLLLPIDILEIFGLVCCLE